MTEHETPAEPDQSSNEHEQDPFTYVGTYPDSVLEVIAAVIERSQDETTMSLTVTIPGGVVSGKVVSRAQWVELTHARMVSDGVDVESANAITKLFTALAPRIGSDVSVNFLHFETAKIWSGSQPIEAFGLRVSLTEISAWTFGHTA